jgi:lipid-A-disaccharide synthase
MQRAAVGIVASGSATLEAAFFRLPFVLVYRVAWLTYFAARAVVKVKHLGMANVLADREIVPEFIQHRARPEAIAAAALRLMSDEHAREAMLRDFDSVMAKLGQSDASATAAKAILQEIGAE